APAAITGVYTNDRVSLAALAGGQALMSFRGQDGKLYWSQYLGGGAWAPVAPVFSPNVSISGTPAIASGATGSLGELGYVDATNGAVYHSRLESTGWSPPALVVMP